MKRSAGILLYRRTSVDGPEVLLGHMGGPFWARKDNGAWSIPKGEVDPGEDIEAAARREFVEELGLDVPDGTWIPLGDIKASGKVITAWAIEAHLDPADVRPGTFDMEWPPGSGRLRSFPEIDRVAWFNVTAASEKIARSQRAFLDRLAALPD